MKKTAYKLLALLLAVLTLAGCLSGCGSSTNGGSGTTANGGSGTTANGGSAATTKADSKGSTDDAELVRVTDVYKSETLDVSFGDKGDYNGVNYIYAGGGYVYFVTYYAGSTDNSYYSGTELWRMKADGTELTQIDIGLEEQVTYYDAEATYTYDYVNVSNAAVAPDGTLWLGVTRSHSDSSDPENYVYEEKNTLTHYDLDGKATDEIDLSGLTDDGSFNLTSVAATADRLYIASISMIYVYDAASGSRIGSIEITDESMWLSKVLVGGDGAVYAYFTGMSASVLRKIDGEALTLGDDIYIGQTEDGSVSLDSYMIYAGYGCTLFYADDQTVSTFDAATGKSDTVLNYINSDLNAAYLNSLTPVSETQMIAVYSDYDDGDSRQSVILLTQVPDEEVTPKRIITFGTVSLDYDIRRAIINFNKTSDEYRIEVRDYSSYNGSVRPLSLTSDTDAASYDSEAGLKQFNTDIISGDVPDIIQISSGMPYDSYVAKGLFADLYPLMDADEDINRTDYLANVLQALETDGKLYSIAPSFSVMTVIGKTSNIGEGTSWTMSEFLDLIKNLPEDTEIFSEMTRASFMEYALTLSASTYLDYAAGECHFDSDSFRALLEVAKLFPEEIDYDRYNSDDFDWTSYELRYRNNQTLLSVQYFSDFSTIYQQEKGNFGDTVSLVGFPSDDGNGSAMILGSQFAIYSKSKNTDGAWAFLKYFLTDEYQEGDEFYAFPVKVSALEKKMASDIEPSTYEDENGNTIEVPNTWWIGSEVIDLGYPTEEDAQRIYDFISSLHTIYRTDSSLMDIVNEEAGAYFAGQKSAADVANIIQNRVSIYLAENR